MCRLIDYTFGLEYRLNGYTMCRLNDYTICRLNDYTLDGSVDKMATLLVSEHPVV